MTKAQILKTAKEIGFEHLRDTIEQLDAIQVDDYRYAFQVTVDGVERWVTIALTAKDTIMDDEGEKVAYDPFIEVDRWEAEKAERAEKQRIAAEKKAATLKRAEERKAKAKAKAEARKQAQAQ